MSVIFHYCSETWTLLADSEQRIQDFKTKCLKRKILRVSCLERKTNDWVLSKISFLEGPEVLLLATVKRRKLAWFGMSHATTASSVSSFRAPWKMGDAVVGRGNAGWTISKIRVPLTELFKFACGKNWKRTSAESSIVPSPYDPVGQRTELN